MKEPENDVARGWRRHLTHSTPRKQLMRSNNPSFDTIPAEIRDRIFELCLWGCKSLSELRTTGIGISTIWPKYNLAFLNVVGGQAEKLIQQRITTSRTFSELRVKQARLNRQINDCAAAKAVAKERAVNISDLRFSSPTRLSEFQEEHNEAAQEYLVVSAELRRVQYEADAIFAVQHSLDDEIADEEQWIQEFRKMEDWIPLSIIRFQQLRDNLDQKENRNELPGAKRPFESLLIEDLNATCGGLQKSKWAPGGEYRSQAGNCGLSDSSWAPGGIYTIDIAIGSPDGLNGSKWAPGGQYRVSAVGSI